MAVARSSSSIYSLLLLLSDPDCIRTSGYKALYFAVILAVYPGASLPILCTAI